MGARSLSLPGNDWIKHAVEFNLGPINYTHRSWFDAIPHGAAVWSLSGDLRAASHLSQYLLEAFHLDTNFVHDFSSPRLRLALIEAPILEHLFLYTGLALRSSEIRTEIDGSHIAELRDALGPECIDFAIKRTPLLGSIPEFEFEPAATDVRSRLIIIGTMFSLPHEAWKNPGYSGRIILKLPRECGLQLFGTSPPLSEMNDNEDLPHLTKRLIRELAPKWQPLFN